MAVADITIENLIEAARTFPCLYDTEMKEYKDDLLWKKAGKAICIERSTMIMNYL